jgi:hypothetical protein
MAYTINTTNGSVIAVVQDATLNTIATSLTLVGRDYAGYGEFLNENFVYLLENFAQDQKNTNNDSTSGPSNPITGQLWYDTSVKTLKVYNGTLSKWKPISSSIAADVEPSSVSSTIGDLWFNTQNNQLYVFAGSPGAGWVLIGPPTTTSGSLSGAVVETIQDSSANNHIAIKFYISNNIVAIMSYDSAYTPNTTLAGFPIINPGFNLVTPDTLAGSQITGDASNALFLNGVGSTQFLRSDQDTTSAYQLTLNGGLVVATDLNIKAVPADNEVRIDNLTNNRDMNFYANVGGNKTRLLKLNATTGSVDFANVSISQLGAVGISSSLTVGTTSTFSGIATFNQNLLPSAPGTVTIGTNTSPFFSAWAQTFYGNLIGNVTAQSITVGNVSIGPNSVTLSGNSFASQFYVNSTIQTLGKNSQGAKRISTSAPTAGDDGDIWYQV